MSLDTSTLYLVATLVAALLGVMLLFFGRQERIAALNWWGAAYILGAAIHLYVSHLHLNNWSHARRTQIIVYSQGPPGRGGNRISQ